jgi:hypothetical protein
MCFSRLKNIKSLTSKNSGTLIVKRTSYPASDLLGAIGIAESADLAN